MATKTIATLAVATLALAAAVAVAACGSDTTTTVIQTTTTTADEATTDSTTDGTPSGSGSVQGLSRAQAGEIAVAEVGGTVNRVYKEDDFGAAWEVEVATPDGEFDVYVSAAGEVVRTRGPKPD